MPETPYNKLPAGIAPSIEQLQAQAWRNLMRSTEPVTDDAVMAAWTVYDAQMRRHHDIDSVRHDH